MQTESYSRSKELIQLLYDTFGESKHTQDAFDRYDQIVADNPGPLGQKMAESYLEWCIAHPARIGSRNKLSSCKCDNGWMVDTVAKEGYRPCSRCLPGAHDLWVSDFKKVVYDESDGML